MQIEVCDAPAFDIDCKSTSRTGYLQDQSSKGFWSLEYYQSYFDIDTKTVSYFHTFDALF